MTPVCTITVRQQQVIAVSMQRLSVAGKKLLSWIRNRLCRDFSGPTAASAGEGKALSPISYNYQLPFQEQLKLWKDNKGSFAEEVRNNPLLRSSFFWALRYGDANTKLQVTEALRWIEDEEMSEILQGLLKQQPLQEEKLQEAALLSLQRLIGSVPEENVLQEAKETSNARLKGLPEWREDWQKVIDQTVSMMDRRFDAVQKKMLNYFGSNS